MRIEAVPSPKSPLAMVLRTPCCKDAGISKRALFNSVGKLSRLVQNSCPPPRVANWT